LLHVYLIPNLYRACTLQEHVWVES